MFFRAYLEDVGDGVGENETLKVEQTLLLYSHKIVSCLQRPTIEAPAANKCGSKAILFSRKKLSFSSMVPRVCNDAPGDMKLMYVG